MVVPNAALRKRLFAKDLVLRAVEQLQSLLPSSTNRPLLGILFSVVWLVVADNNMTMFIAIAH